MIPGTAIPTTRPATEESVQPLAPAKAVSDLLSEFGPGQRVLATIQSQLPNGTYRAMIAQRDVTLALPFAAKAGDTLELEVVDSRGRLTFAVVADAPDAKAAGKESVTATLSRTAQLISALLPGTKGSGQSSAPPATLNAGQPLLPKVPESAAALPPVLARAVGESGMFYESHQAAWVSGSLAKAALLAEPQGKLPASPLTATGAAARSSADLNPPAPAATGSVSNPVSAANTNNPPAAGPLSANGSSETAAPRAGQPPPAAPAASSPGAGLDESSRNLAATVVRQPLPSIPAEVAPLVQQQLSALASNVYAWQGLAWPGQNIEWEIVDEDSRRNNRGDPDAPPPWQTRLRLSLPSLGAVDAMLTLRGEQVDVALVSRREDARRTLQQGTPILREQFAAAGLQLAGIDVRTGDANETD